MLHCHSALYSSLKDPFKTCTSCVNPAKASDIIKSRVLTTLWPLTSLLPVLSFQPSQLYSHFSLQVKGIYHSHSCLFSFSLYGDIASLDIRLVPHFIRCFGSNITSPEVFSTPRSAKLCFFHHSPFPSFLPSTHYCLT